MAMLNQLIGLLAFQLAGEVLVRGLGLPLPGPVAGMMLLFFWLWIRDNPGQELLRLSTWVQRHMGLLFVPTGVGLMTQYERLGQQWFAIIAGLFVSTAVTLIVTGYLMSRLGGAETGGEP